MSIHLAVSGPSGEQVIECDDFRTLLVGRSEAAHICVAQDRYFSRNHCYIELAPPQARVVDLNSHNGTLVNGSRISEAWLRNGDVISGGKTEIRVVIPQDDLHRTLTLNSRPSTLVAVAQSAALHAPPVDLSERETCELRRIGRYEILDEMGRGGMGVVYRARQLPSRQLVAVKVIIPTRALNEVQSQLFLREASVLSSLSHKRIVRLIEFGMDAGRLFFAMEFVDHRSFEDWSQNMTGTQKLRLACGVVAQALEALHYTHRRGVVHRDIKPSNLLLGKMQQKLAVRVVDFGLAKYYADAGFSGITSEGDVRGTLGFIAPEQLVDSQKALPASDLYSVGATLYYYLSGQYVYDVHEGDDPIQAILNQRRVPLSERAKELPPQLTAFLDRATAPSPELRYSSAAEMRCALNPFLKK